MYFNAQYTTMQLQHFNITNAWPDDMLTVMPVPLTKVWQMVQQRLVSCTGSISFL